MLSLETDIKKHLLTDLPNHSRVHPLPSFHSSSFRCFIKRDDELGLMGSKIRKFSSLIAFMLKQKIEEAAVIGGANSNHVLGLSQFLIEKKIEPRLFLCVNNQEKAKGNALLIKLLVPENQIIWIERNQWKEVQEIASNYAHKTPQKKIMIIPEGGCMPEALPGALSLPCDIKKNEKELGFAFDHFFIDSGTGLMAFALILGLTFLQHAGHVHVTLIAGKEEEFLEKLKIFHRHFLSLGFDCPPPSRFSLCKPLNAKSFGSVTAKTLQTVQEIAQDEGILCDPIYNAKLLSEAKRKIFTENLKGNGLIIQSGGTLSLLGFLS